MALTDLEHKQLRAAINKMTSYGGITGGRLVNTADVFELIRHYTEEFYKETDKGK